jgi:hypothetical protein
MHSELRRNSPSVDSLLSSFSVVAFFAGSVGHEPLADSARARTLRRAINAADSKLGWLGTAVPGGCDSTSKRAEVDCIPTTSEGSS